MDFRTLARTVIQGDSGQKALVSSDLVGPVPRVLGGGPFRRTLANRSAGVHLGAYGGHDAIDWVMDCVNLYAETTSNAEHHFERKGEKIGTGERYDRRVPADLAALVEQPNPWMPWWELLELTAIDYLCAGNSFWLKFRPTEDGRPIGLWRLSPALITIHPNASGVVGAYEYKVPGAEPVTFEPADVVHFRRPNPHDNYWGASVISGGPRVYDLELALTFAQQRYFAEGTRLDGVLESDKNIPPSTLDKIKREWRALYSGAENSHKVAILERGLRYRAIQSSASEAEYARLGQLSRDRILSAFRVPAPLLGQVEGADRQAVREAQRIFDNKTIRPFLNKLQDTISSELTQAWGLDFVFDYEYVMPPEDQLALITNFAALPGVRVREVREKAGLDPLDDERDEIVLNLPGIDDKNAGGIPDRNLGDEAGRPPQPEKTRAFPQPGEKMPDGAAARHKPGGQNG